MNDDVLDHGHRALMALQSLTRAHMRGQDSFDRSEFLAATVRAALDAQSVEITRMREAAQAWSLYAFQQHGDDSRLYNGLADLGGVDRDGRGWVHVCADCAARGRRTVAAHRDSDAWRCATCHDAAGDVQDAQRAAQ
jgi:hypothetical protein